MTEPAPHNPFPGPQPYSAEDQHAFFGRDAMCVQLAAAVRSHRALTVFGPSGAGKSSLIQAALLPVLLGGETMRCVSISAWPGPSLAGSPSEQLLSAVGQQLSLGITPTTVAEAVELAFYISSRPIVVVLDQLEQLLLQYEQNALEAFILLLAELQASREGLLHLLLVLREDDLGRWSAMLANHRALKQHTFRVRRLTIDEALDAVCQTASQGRPQQRWEPAQLRPFLQEITLPGAWYGADLEVESAYVQVVCRHLWRAGGLGASHSRSAGQILEDYLTDSLQGLAQHEDRVRRLLEERLIHDRSGRRLQISRSELVDEIGSADDTTAILAHLEQARILRRQAWRGDTLFELGHDWLAEPIREAAAMRRAVAARRRARRRGLAVGAAFLGLAAVSLVLAGLYFRAEEQRELALAAQTAADQQRAAAEQAREDEADQRAKAEAAREVAQAAQASAETSQSEAEAAQARAEASFLIANQARLDEASARRVAEDRAAQILDNQRMLATRELEDDPGRAAPFLASTDPSNVPVWWRYAALRILQHPLGQQPTPVQLSAWNNQLTALSDTLVALDAQQRPVLLAADGSVSVLTGSVLSLASGASGRLVTTDELGQIAIWPSDQEAQSLTPHPRAVWASAIDRTGERLVTADRSGRAVLHTLSGGEPTPLLADGRVVSVDFLPGGDLLTATASGQLARWSADGALSAELRARDPEARSNIQLVRVDETGSAAVAWSDGRIAWWPLDGGRPESIPPMPAPAADIAFRPGAPGQRAVLDLDGHLRVSGVQMPQRHGPYRAVAYSPDGAWLATGGDGGRAALWELGPEGQPVSLYPLLGLSGEPLRSLFFPDSQTLVTASQGGIRRWQMPLARLSERLDGVDGRDVTALAITDDGLVTIQRRDGNRLSWDVAGTPVAAGAGGALLSSARIDGATRFWGEADGRIGTSRSGEAPAHLVGHFAEIRVLAASPDGRWLASASEDGTLRRWRILGVAEFQQHLLAARLPCSLVSDRVRYLGESELAASTANEACLER